MSNTLPLTVTTAGRAALVNAKNTGTAPVLVAAVGVTDTAFAATTDLTALPGELKQLVTFAGDVVADDTIHVSISDSSSDTYSLRGFGLYFDDGTLFAVYSQEEVILEKSSQSTLLLATDTIFADLDASSIAFGDTSFINPAATTERQGVVELATAAEASTGSDATRAMTPATAKAVLDARLGAGAPSGFIKSLLNKASAAALRLALEIKGAALYDTGSGKGLDADKLDGQHGAYYLQWDKFTGVPTSFPPASHSHSAGDITSGTLGVARGGLGRGSLTAGAYLVGAGTNAVALKNPTDVLADIGAAKKSHSHSTGDINGLASALADLMPKTWALTAGAGLSGGGSGSADRTIRMGTPDTITGSSSNSASGTTHTHKLDTGTGASQIPRNSDLGSASKRNDDYFALKSHTHELGDIEHFTQGVDWARFNQLPNTDTEGFSMRFSSHSGGNTIYWRYNNSTIFTMYPDGSPLFYGEIQSDVYNYMYARIADSYLRQTTVSHGFADGNNDWILRCEIASKLVDVYGDLRVRGGTLTAPKFSSSSDRRLKHDITPRQARRRLADMLRFSAWLWNRDDAPDLGLIAQEVQEVAPEYVSEGDDGMLAIDKASIALEAVIGLAARVRELESRHG